MIPASSGIDNTCDFIYDIKESPSYAAEAELEPDVHLQETNVEDCAGLAPNIASGAVALLGNIEEDMRRRNLFY